MSSMKLVAVHVICKTRKFKFWWDGFEFRILKGFLVFFFRKLSTICFGIALVDIEKHKQIEDRDQSKIVGDKKYLIQRCNFTSSKWLY